MDSTVSLLLFLACIPEPIAPQLSVSVEELPMATEATIMALSEFVVIDTQSMDKHADRIDSYCTEQDSGIPADVEAHYAVLELLPDQLKLSGRPIVELTDYIVSGDEFNDLRIDKLYHAIGELIDDSKLVSSVFGGGCAAATKILLVAANDVPFSTLRALKFTLAQAKMRELYSLSQPLGGNSSSIIEGKLGATPLWVQKELLANFQDG
jgi:hypothetical protein